MNQVLKFGKFKGQIFSTTPKWYQEWLLKQSWFKLDNGNNPEQEIGRLSKKLRGWDGYSRRGQAIEAEIFHNEMALADKYDPAPDPFAE